MNEANKMNIHNLKFNKSVSPTKCARSKRIEDHIKSTHIKCTEMKTTTWTKKKENKMNIIIKTHKCNMLLYIRSPQKKSKRKKSKQNV